MRVNFLPRQRRVLGKLGLEKGNIKHRKATPLALRPASSSVYIGLRFAQFWPMSVNIVQSLPHVLRLAIRADAGPSLTKFWRVFAKLWLISARSGRSLAKICQRPTQISEA